MDRNRPKKVSIAMTAYNGEKYILEQLGSILVQTRQPDEVVICDDGSSDHTASLIDDFIKANKLKTWRLYVNTANLGFIKNFYQAISLTSGEVIFLCDQDDIWYSDKIAKMVKLFEENARIKILNSGFKKIDHNGQPIYLKRRFHRSNNNLISQKLKPEEVRSFRFHHIIWRNISPGCTLAFTDEIRAFFLKHHTELCPHDWEMNIFGAVLDGLFFYNAELTGYRIHVGNTIGLADLTLRDRVSGKTADKRIELIEQEYRRAGAYMNAPWGKMLDRKQRKVLNRYYWMAFNRFRAMNARKFGLWLKLLIHPRDYLKLRGSQGILNDFMAIKYKQC